MRWTTGRGSRAAGHAALTLTLALWCTGGCGTHSGDETAPPAVSAALGPAGGVVELVVDAPVGALAGARLTVPPGALAQTVTVRLAAVPDAPPFPNGAPPLAAVRLEPEGLAFIQPATLALRFDAAALQRAGWLGADLLQLMDWVPATREWVPLPGARVDPATAELAAPIEHFSFKGLITPLLFPPAPITDEVRRARRPVLLVHGLQLELQGEQRLIRSGVAGATETWGALSPEDEDLLGATPNPVPVYELRYYSHNVIESSACALGAAVREVLASHPGHDGVDIVAHSLGGVVARTYTLGLGTYESAITGAAVACPYGDDVHRLMMLASPHGGSHLAWADDAAPWRRNQLDAGDQLQPGSDFLTRLNALPVADLRGPEPDYVGLLAGADWVVVGEHGSLRASLLADPGRHLDFEVTLADHNHALHAFGPGIAHVDSTAHAVWPYLVDFVGAGADCDPATWQDRCEGDVLVTCSVAGGTRRLDCAADGEVCGWWEEFGAYGCRAGACVPDCLGKWCDEPDGCGGTCAADCRGWICGRNLCGHDCGACAEGLTCVDTSFPPACVGPPGCEGLPPEGRCEGLLWHYCLNGHPATADCSAPYLTCGWNESLGQFSCVPASGCEAADIARSCAGRECGDDGCGGDCGPCPDGERCTDGVCLAPGACRDVPPEGRCDGTVWTYCDGGVPQTRDCAAAGQACRWRADEGAWGCDCAPRCEGRRCGPDGCGGTCGPACPSGQFCAQDGACVAERCDPSGRVCQVSAWTVVAEDVDVEAPVVDHGAEGFVVAGVGGSYRDTVAVTLDRDGRPVARDRDDADYLSDAACDAAGCLLAARSSSGSCESWSSHLLSGAGGGLTSNAFTLGSDTVPLHCAVGRDGAGDDGFVVCALWGSAGGCAPRPNEWLVARVASDLGGPALGERARLTLGSVPGFPSWPAMEPVGDGSFLLLSPWLAADAPRVAAALGGGDQLGVYRVWPDRLELALLGLVDPVVAERAGRVVLWTPNPARNVVGTVAGIWAERPAGGSDGEGPPQAMLFARFCTGAICSASAAAPRVVVEGTQNEELSTAPRSLLGSAHGDRFVLVYQEAPATCADGGCPLRVLLLDGAGAPLGAAHTIYALATPAGRAERRYNASRIGSAGTARGRFAVAVADTLWDGSPAWLVAVFEERP